ncbi:MAG: type 4a pilus biogenesis protein PilO [Gemmatimonadetes bacterium]|nr:type 4a pilus biogenesis protein PilO [Gemmatimonadota bacterium]
MALLPSDPKLKKQAILGMLVLALLGYGIHEYLYTPRTAEVAVMEQRLEGLQLQNQTARALTQGEGVADVERRLAMYREQLVAVEGLIPLSEELPDLLDAISAEAQRTGVDLTLLQPTGATQEEFYTRRTYDLAVVGSYHDIGFFLARIGSLPRIVTPIGPTLTPRTETGRGGSPRLEARFSIETYVLPAPGTGTPTENTDAE